MKKMVVDFETLSGIPIKYIERLKLYDAVFMQYNFLEHLVHDKNIFQLIVEIDYFCSENNVIGYHYTNGVERDFIEKGILVRTGSEIRHDFIKKHIHLFLDKEQRQILDKWKEQFDTEEAQLRDKSIYFNFSKEALNNGGAEDLLKYYGGEQVYLPLLALPRILKKLEKIGIPMILKCKLNPIDIISSIEYPWGKIAVSCYHRIINPIAFMEDQDGYQKADVNPENIEIIKFDNH